MILLIIFSEQLLMKVMNARHPLTIFQSHFTLKLLSLFLLHWLEDNGCGLTLEVILSQHFQQIKELSSEAAQAQARLLVSSQWWREVVLETQKKLQTFAKVIIHSGRRDISMILLLEPPSHFDENLTYLSSRVVAYHFCQSDVASTCHVPEFVHSLAAQLSQCPQLAAYLQVLQDEAQCVCKHLSSQSCAQDPSKAFVQGVLEPLKRLSSTGQLSLSLGIIVVDGVCEAQHHRPDYGDTIASFLHKHIDSFPAWLKIVTTVRTSAVDILHNLPFHQIRSVSKQANISESLLQNVCCVAKVYWEYFGKLYWQTKHHSCSNPMTPFTQWLNKQQTLNFNIYIIHWLIFSMFKLDYHTLTNMKHACLWSLFMTHSSNNSIPSHQSIIAVPRCI